MDLSNLYNLLDTAQMDEKAGIKLQRVTGDEHFSFYVAEILPMTWLKPHYHGEGIELYQIIEGEGVMKTGRNENNLVIWDEEYTVRKGDCFTIPEGRVHQIGNLTNLRLIAGFTCPPSHLAGDRFFV